MQTVGKNMTAGSPLKHILALSLPLMVANAFQQIYTVADTAIVGNVLGLGALAALGAVDWFNWMMLSIVQGLAQGFSVRMARQFGASDFAGLRRTIGNACTLSILCAAALTACAQVLTPFVLQILQTPEEIVARSLAYIRIIFWGLPVVMAFNLFSAILRSVGDGKTPLLAMVIACAVNITAGYTLRLFLCHGRAGRGHRHGHRPGLFGAHLPARALAQRPSARRQRGSAPAGKALPRPDGAGRSGGPRKTWSFPWAA